MNQSDILNMYYEQIRTLISRHIDQSIKDDHDYLTEIMKQDNPEQSFVNFFYLEVEKIVESASLVLADYFWKHFGYSTTPEVVVAFLRQKFKTLSAPKLSEEYWSLSQQLDFSDDDDDDSYENYDDSYESSF